jgi:hypothetical protein
MAMRAFGILLLALSIGGSPATTVAMPFRIMATVSGDVAAPPAELAQASHHAGHATLHHTKPAEPQPKPGLGDLPDCCAGAACMALGLTPVVPLAKPAQPTVLASAVSIVPTPGSDTPASPPPRP